jgi:hypothetical protein
MEVLTSYIAVHFKALTAFPTVGPFFPSSEETLSEIKFPDCSVNIVVPEFCCLLMRTCLDGLEDSFVEVCRTCIVCGGKYIISKLLCLQ